MSVRATSDAPALGFDSTGEPTAGGQFARSTQPERHGNLSGLARGRQLIAEPGFSDRQAPAQISPILEGVPIMPRSRQSAIAGVLTGVFLVFPVSDQARATPVIFAGTAVVAAQGQIVEARYRSRVRHHYRGRSGVGPSAILGMFGAVIGAAALANSYDNYSNYSYGGLNNYGYSPGYGGGYGGGGGFGGGRGGHGGGHVGGGHAGSGGQRAGGGHGGHR